MSRFDSVKEKVSEVAEKLDARTDEAVERGKSEYHDLKAEKAERRAESLDEDPKRGEDLDENDPDRRDRLKPTAA